MTFEGLTPGAKKFLLSLNKKGEDLEHDPGLPVYLRVDDFFFLVQSLKLKTDMHKTFEKRAAEHNLYRGGAVIMIQSNIWGTDSMIVVPDKNHRWAKPIVGLVHHDEGMDLIRAGRRKLNEEVSLFTWDKGSRKRIIPKESSHIDALGLNPEELVECGEVVLKYFDINNNNRAFEAVMVWEVDSEEEFSCIHNKHSGLIPYAIALSDQRLLGVFSGQEGFLSLPEYGLHPSIENYLKKK